jgi:hypothetical protein
MKLNTYIIYCFTEFGSGTYLSKGYSIGDCYNRLTKRQQKQLQTIADEDGNEYWLDDILELASELHF